MQKLLKWKVILPEQPQKEQMMPEKLLELPTILMDGKWKPKKRRKILYSSLSCLNTGDFAILKIFKLLY
jgi:hypothetical protein